MSERTALFPAHMTPEVDLQGVLHDLNAACEITNRISAEGSNSDAIMAEMPESVRNCADFEELPSAWKVLFAVAFINTFGAIAENTQINLFEKDQINTMKPESHDDPNLLDVLADRSEIVHVEAADNNRPSNRISIEPMALFGYASAFEHRAKLRESFKETTTDQMSGKILSKEGFNYGMKMYRDEIVQRHENGEDLSDLYAAYFFVDLDKLKTINDKYGHESGDSYLKTMADIFINAFREPDAKIKQTSFDLIARTGGDEHEILMKDLVGSWLEDNAEGFLQDIRSRVGSHLIEIIDEKGKVQKIKVGASVGMATIPLTVFLDPDWSDKLEKEYRKIADVNMYAHKNQRKIWRNIDRQSRFTRAAIRAAIRAFQPLPRAVGMIGVRPERPVILTETAEPELVDSVL